jgi:lipid A 3-O-deacylase
MSIRPSSRVPCRRSEAVRRALAGCVVALVALAPAARGETSIAPAWLSGSVSAISENDKWAFRGADQHYTNGIRLGWLSREIRTDTDPVLGWARRLATALPLLDPSGRTRVGLALGQNLYTPSDTRRATRDAADRPYAGWLYGGLAIVNEVQMQNRRHRNDRIETLEINVGIVGPSAGGEIVQNRWHGIIGVEPAMGWRHQLPDEPGLVVFYETKWRSLFDLDLPRALDGIDVDVIPHAAVSLGNVATYGALGGTLRLGQDLDIDYGPPRIRPALSGSGFHHHSDGFGAYVFVGFEARVVGYDMFLDGPLFRDGASVERRPLVADVQAGVAMTWRGARIAFTHVLRTREFESQPQSDRFGALSITIGR